MTKHKSDSQGSPSKTGSSKASTGDAKRCFREMIRFCESLDFHPASTKETDEVLSCVLETSNGLLAVVSVVKRIP